MIFGFTEKNDIKILYLGEFFSSGCFYCLFVLFCDQTLGFYNCLLDKRQKCHLSRCSSHFKTMSSFAHLWCSCELMCTGSVCMYSIYMFMCVSVWVCVLQNACGDQRTPSGILPSLPLSLEVDALGFTTSCALLVACKPLGILLSPSPILF